MGLCELFTDRLWLISIPNDQCGVLTCPRKCKRLVVYGSLTLIGAASTYHVEESEEVAGAKLMREQEADWDW